MKKRVGLFLLALLAVSVLVFGQSDTFERLRLSAGTTQQLAEVTSAGALLVSSSGTASAAPSDATTFPRVRLAGGTTGNLAEVDSTGHVLVALPTGTVWSAAEGGTGLSTYAVGDLLYASATTPTLAKLAAVASGQVLASAGTGTAPGWSKAPTLTAGGGTQTYKLGGTLYWENPAIGNAADTLFVSNTAYSLPAGTLATDGDQVIVEADFLYDATAATKTLSCNIGYTAWDSTAGFTAGLFFVNTTTTNTSVSSHLRGEVTRTGATTAAIQGRALTTSAVQGPVYSNANALTWANAQNILCHTKSSVGTANVTTLYNVRVSWNPR